MLTPVLICQTETTTIGKDAAPLDVRAKVSQYLELGKLAAHATLVEFPRRWQLAANVRSAGVPQCAAGWAGSGAEQAVMVCCLVYGGL
jgi:hypothetical protein